MAPLRSFPPPPPLLLSGSQISTLSGCVLDLPLCAPLAPTSRKNRLAKKSGKMGKSPQIPCSAFLVSPLTNPIYGSHSYTMKFGYTEYHNTKLIYSNYKMRTPWINWKKTSTGVMVPQFNKKPLQFHHSRAHQIHLMSIFTLSTCPCLPQHLVQTGKITSKYSCSTPLFV